MKRVLNRLTSNRTLAVVWLTLLSGLWWLITRLPGFSWAWAVVTLCVAAAVGLLMRWNWARILAVILFALYCANTVVHLFASSWKTSRVFVATGAAALAWGLWRKPDEGWFDDVGQKPAEHEPPNTLISLVLLRSRQRYTEPLILA